MIFVLGKKIKAQKGRGGKNQMLQKNIHPWINLLLDKITLKKQHLEEEHKIIRSEWNKKK